MSDKIDPIAEQLAHELYKKGHVYDAWAEESEHIRLSYITNAETILEAVRAIGYVLVPEQETAAKAAEYSAVVAEKEKPAGRPERKRARGDDD